MKYLSLFSGIGGFELGIQQAWNEWHKNNGCEIGTAICSAHQPPICVGYSEIDKYAIQIYNKHFNHKNYGDITTLNIQELPDFELLVGGFPCQSFSIAGKRRGFDDTRGTLFFNIAEIIREKQPRLLLLENVKGILSHNKGSTFYTIISTLDELGYDCQWQVLNSKNFGVPQNRERVFIIGHLRGTSRPEVFPITGGSGESNNKTDKQGYSNTLTGRSAGGQNRRGNYINVVAELNSPTWKKRNESIRRVYGTDGIAPTIPTGTGGGVMPKIVKPVLTPDRPEKRQNGRRFKENGEPSFTLTAQDRHGIYDGAKIRRLTPMECERLQGFPDGWTSMGLKETFNLKSSGDEVNHYIEISDTQRYKVLGNAVTTNVIKEIVCRLVK